MSGYQDLSRVGNSLSSSQSFCRYSQFSDRFLRIGFANDRLSGLAYFDLGKDLLSRLKDIMLHGLHICNRTFIFLGYSNSQLRDHACWLYCEEDLHLDGAPTAAHIRASAGDLSNILIPAKHAARLAQCFSSTYETFRLSPDHICKIPEVVAQGRVVRNSDGVLVSVPGEEFSDGVGVITSEGMQLVIKNLPSRQQQRLIGCDVAAIQIRMGGCKGVLARWDNHRCTQPILSCSCSTVHLGANMISLLGIWLHCTAARRNTPNHTDSFTSVYS